MERKRFKYPERSRVDPDLEQALEFLNRSGIRAFRRHECDIDDPETMAGTGVAGMSRNAVIKLANETARRQIKADKDRNKRIKRRRKSRRKVQRQIIKHHRR